MEVVATDAWRKLSRTVVNSAACQRVSGMCVPHPMRTGRPTEDGSLAKCFSKGAALARGDNYDSERVKPTSGKTPNSLLPTHLRENPYVLPLLFAPKPRSPRVRQTADLYVNP